MFPCITSLKRDPLFGAIEDPHMPGDPVRNDLPPEPCLVVDPNDCGRLMYIVLVLCHEMVVICGNYW